jgi:hypothetical protein
LLRFDGLYRTDKIVYAKEVITIEGTRLDGQFRYLRFYADGTVVSASTAVESGQGPDEARVAKWLNNSNPDIPAGRYAIDGPKLSFDAVSKEGTVSYRGVIEGEVLKLNWRSSINQREGSEEYRFVPLDAKTTATEASMTK